MERQELTSETIDWPALIRHVIQDQVTVELADGEVPLVRLVPVRRPRTLADLENALRSIEPLGDDAESFANDLDEQRNAALSLDDPWES